MTYLNTFSWRPKQTLINHYHYFFLNLLLNLNLSLLPINKYLPRTDITSAGIIDESILYNLLWILYINYITYYFFKSFIRNYFYIKKNWYLIYINIWPKKKIQFENYDKNIDINVDDALFNHLKSLTPLEQKRVLHLMTLKLLQLNEKVL